MRKEKKTVEKQIQKTGGTWEAFRMAFPYTIPVLTGYLFIGFAFGVMFQNKGYNFIWAGIMSVLVYAGSGQYLAVNFFVPGYSLLQMVFLEFMVNIRHIFYGLSMLERFQNMGKKRLYMIFSLTDETYSLLCLTHIPKGVDESKFLFFLALLDHSYWILGSILGAAAGSAVPFNAQGIDFAMTALFVVIFLEQWLTSSSHMPAYIGVGSTLACLLVFGSGNFILPSMVCIMTLLLLHREKMQAVEG